MSKWRHGSTTCGNASQLVLHAEPRFRERLARRGSTARKHCASALIVPAPSIYGVPGGAPRSGGVWSLASHGDSIDAAPLPPTNPQRLPQPGERCASLPLIKSLLQSDRGHDVFGLAEQSPGCDCASWSAPVHMGHGPTANKEMRRAAYWPSPNASRAAVTAALSPFCTGQFS